MRVIVFLTLASLFFGTMTAPAAQEYKGQIKLAWPGSSDVITVSLPGKSRMLEINAPGFKTETSRTEPDGRRYVEATNSVSGVILSAFFSYIDPSEKSVSCRNSLPQWTARNMWLRPTGIKSSKLGEAEMVEYLIPEVHGKPIEQKNVFACLAEDGFFADIHVSKVQFKPDEESMLISIVKAAHFKDALEADSSSVVVLKPGEASEASVPGPALGSMA